MPVPGDLGVVSEPRIPPLAVADWPKAMHEALAALLPENPRHPRLQAKGRPKALNALGTLAQHPELARAFNTFNGHIIYNTSLSPRQRELLVLRVAHLRASEYEWAQHLVLAADLGITEDEVAQLIEGPDAAGWSAVEGALVRAADELVADAVIADSTWVALAAELDTHQLMDVVFTVGAYDLLAMAFRSFGIELDDDLT
jgi:alkylhydroperoxidase family enzyme